MLGVVVNTATVIAGSLIGLLFKKGIPQKLSNALTVAVALAVAYIGIDGMLNGQNTLILILSLVIGVVIGTLVNLDGAVRRIGDKIQARFKKENDSSQIAQGFVGATLLFCVGAMTVVGALQSGLSQNHEMQFTKAILDFISSIILASTLGWGVILAAVSVFVIQGAIVLLAGFIEPYLSTAVINEMTCVGSVLIFALALNLLGVTKIKVMNFVPAIFIPIILCLFM